MEDFNICKARDWFWSIFHKTEVFKCSKISHLKLFHDHLQKSGLRCGAILISLENPNIWKARDSLWSKFHRRDIVRHSKISRLKFFLILSSHLGGVLGPSSSPCGTPTSGRPGTDFGANFIEKILLGIVKRFIWIFFLTLSSHLGGVLGPTSSPWGTPT